MKKGNNNEIDLALRSLSRSARGELASNDGNSFWNNNEAIGEHLDTDELNGYAEGQIPELARAKYTEHLADCDSCRKILVDLTQALGTGHLIAKAEVEVERGPGFWQRISAFMSPPFLRYAVPTLALTAIIAISLVALRQQRQPEFIAQQQPRQVPEGVNPVTAPESTTASQPLATPSGNVAVGSRDSITATNQAIAKDSAAAPAEQPKLATTSDVSNTAPAFRDSLEPAPPPAPSSVPFSSQTPFSEKKVGELATGRSAVNEVQKSADRKLEPSEQVAQDRERTANKPEVRKETEEDNLAFSKDAPSGPRRSDGIASGRGVLGRKAKGETSDEDQSRSVSGRRFQRRGGVWMDTAYESSRATINVQRGSEQFRALVADEPGLRTIANTLAGEVIVVWNGKVYRIR